MSAEAGDEDREQGSEASLAAPPANGEPRLAYRAGGWLDAAGKALEHREGGVR